MNEKVYPWYAAIEGESLEQGDIIDACPVYSPPRDLRSDYTGEVVFDSRNYDLIVASQSCDLAHEKLEHVLLCKVWLCSELSRDFPLEDARRGNLPAYHLLNECRLDSLDREFRIVDFREMCALPLLFLKEFMRQSGKRLRLLPPYREHFAQAFARFFMRVGLPQDIPPFKKSKGKRSDQVH